MEVLELCGRGRWGLLPAVMWVGLEDDGLLEVEMVDYSRWLGYLPARGVWSPLGIFSRTLVSRAAGGTASLWHTRDASRNCQSLFRLVSPDSKRDRDYY